MFRRTKRLVLTAMAGTALLHTAPARADDESLPWTARLVSGTSAGEPPAAKVATVVGLYTAAAASFAGGLVFTLSGVSAGSDAEDFAAGQPRNFCADRASVECATYLSYRRDESTKLLFGEALLGGSALLLLSGALTAELWENEPVTLSASVGGSQAQLGFSASF